MEAYEEVRATSLAGEASGFDRCWHEVCFLDNRQWTCLIRSGEVLREYSTEEGRLAWAVYACNEGGELVSGGRHVVISSESEYMETKKDELFERHVEERAIEANRVAEQQKSLRRTVESELKRLGLGEQCLNGSSTDGSWG